MILTVHQAVNPGESEIIRALKEFHTKFHTVNDLNPVLEYKTIIRIFFSMLRFALNLNFSEKIPEKPRNKKALQN